MKALELNDLEKDIIAKCNELTKPHGLEVGKYKIKRSTKYCITQDGYNILSNDDLIQVHKFCQDKSDLETLALTAPAMVKNYKEKEAAGAWKNLSEANQRSLKRAQLKYANKVLITKVSANPSTETEIYQWLNQQANRSGAIKTLIEREIAGKEAELSANHKLLACMQWHITQHQEQFGLFFVEYSSHMRREDLFIALEGTYASSIITVDYSAFKGSQQTYLDEWLHEILTKKRLHQNVVAINLVGFENLLLLGEAKVLSAAERINTRTEYFKELNVPLFFWTTNQARLEVLKYASGFYSLHKDVLIVD